MAAVRGADPRLLPRMGLAGSFLLVTCWKALVCLGQPIPATQLCYDGATRFYDFEFVFAGCFEVDELKGQAVSRYNQSLKCWGLTTHALNIICKSIFPPKLCQM